MNDRARELLIKAALDGVPQTRGTYSSGGAYCAIGLLEKAAGCFYPRQQFIDLYDIQEWEADEIMYANDHLGWDFLTIARKVGVENA